MAADRPAAQPPDTVKVRGQLRAVWLPLWLAAAVACVPLGMYGDTPEDTLGSHQIFLSVFLLLAAVLVVLGVRSFGRGLDADGDGVVVRNMFRATSIPWRDLAAIEFKGVDSEALSNMYYTLVFLRQDGSRVTTDAPGGGIRPGEYLFELRERLLTMQSAALGYRQRGEDQQGDREDSWPAYPDAPADRPSDAAGTDDEVAIPATRSRVKRWGGRIAGVAVALAFVVVPLPSSGWLLWNVGRVLHVDVMPLQVYWEDVQPGMCVREDPNGTDYLVVDCNAEHQEEVISRSTLARSDEWPGDAAVEDMAGEKCKPAFATYVGLELDQSRLDFDFATPDESSWNDLRHPSLAMADDRQSHTDLSRVGSGPRPNHRCIAGRPRIATPTPCNPDLAAGVGSTLATRQEDSPHCQDDRNHCADQTCKLNYHERLVDSVADEINRHGISRHGALLRRFSLLGLRDDPLPSNCVGIVRLSRLASLG